jgi:cytochrome o ubiquinol oxidase subunit 2
LFGLSAQFSGDGFSDMRFDVKVVAPNDFDGWVAATRGHGDTLDLAREAKLAQPSKADPPMTFGALAPGLFDAIVSRSAPNVAGDDKPAQGQ